MKRGRFFVIIIIILFIIFIHYLGWLKPIENFARQVINPGAGRIYKWSVAFEGNEEKFDSVEDLEDAYIALKNSYLSAVVDKTELELLKEENKELREQLNFLESAKYNMVGAFVIGESIEPLRNSLIIDRGDDDGIAVGQPVVVNKGILVGKIIRTEKNTSIVQLINDHQSRVAGSIMNKDKSIGVIEGGYGISIRMNFIPQNELVQTGETIITSGLEENIPYGLVVGSIDVVEKEAYQPFQKAIITPIANLEKIREVSVITNI